MAKKSAARSEEVRPARAANAAVLPDLLEGRASLEGKAAPALPAGADEGSRKRLSDAAGRIRDGDDVDLPSSKPARGGTTGRGLAPGCVHSYLRSNRFEWWDLQELGLVPSTDAIKPRPNELPGLSVDEWYCREFCSPVSTVVGTDVELIPVPVGRTVRWDTAEIDEGASPNEVPSLEFTMRASPPGSATPTVATLPVSLPALPDQQFRKIVIHAVADDDQLHPSARHPSLHIDFRVPQRAVGLECGYLGPRDTNIDAHLFRLIAYNRQGQPIPGCESSGADLIDTLSAQDRWHANRLSNRIGVRDRAGGIASVELRLEMPVGRRPGLIQLVVYRIWHEAFPAAVVKQGTVGAGGLDLALPYHCNQAAAILRGFKLQFTDQQPRELRALGVTLGRLFPSRTIANGVRLTFSYSLAGHPGDFLRTDPAVAVHSALAYFSVLAWDDSQVELRTISAAGSAHAEDSVLEGVIDVTDPCRAHPDEIAAVGPDQACGLLYGALHGFRFGTDQVSKIDVCALALGILGGSGCALEPAGAASPALISPAATGFPGLGRMPNLRIRWQYCGLIEGCFDRYGVDVSGDIITGRSLRVGSGLATAGRAAAVPQVNRRPAPDHFFLDLGGVVPWNVEAEMAFVGLGTFLFEPAGPIAEMEIEVHGTDYDGTRVAWRLGAGLATEPPGGSDTHSVFGLPNVGAVVRKVHFEAPRLATQELRLSMTPGFVALTPDQYGALRNVGSAAALLSRITWGGAQVAEFNFLAEYRGAILREYDLARRAPIELLPGETLLIGGRFLPLASATPNDSPRQAWLEFHTNDPQARLVRVNATGTIVANRADGHWLPPEINFGLVGFDPNVPHADRPYSRFRNALLESVGSTPLLVQALALDTVQNGFEFALFQISGSGQPSTASLTPGYQLDPGDWLMVQTYFRPVSAGPVQAKLIAQTNAGRAVELTLLGEGMSY